MTRSRSIGTNTEKPSTKSVGTQTKTEEHHLNKTYNVESRSSRSKLKKKQMNKTYEINSDPTTQMDHSGLDESSPKPMTSKEARAKSEPAKLIAKKQSQDETHVSMERPAYSSEQAHHHGEEIRFQLSDVSNNHHSPLNVTNIAEQMDHLAVSTPKVVNKRKSSSKRVIKPIYDMENTLESSAQSNSKMPRRSERLKLKRLNGTYNVNLKHVTMRPNNSRYLEQQRQVKNSRRPHT